MTEILLAIGILGGLGLVFGLVLAAASRVFYVETDPRLEQLMNFGRAHSDIVKIKE